MNFDDFHRSLTKSAPPSGLSVELDAIWWAGKQDWDCAHRLVQDRQGANAAWIHAYLHRVEGDLANASYWYRQAGRAMPTCPPDAEWRQIAESLLAARSNR